MCLKAAVTGVKETRDEKPDSSVYFLHGFMIIRSRDHQKKSAAFTQKYFEMLKQV